MAGPSGGASRTGRHAAVRTHAAVVGQGHGVRGLRRRVHERAGRVRTALGTAPGAGVRAGPERTVSPTIAADPAMGLAFLDAADARYQRAATSRGATPGAGLGLGPIRECAADVPALIALARSGL